MLEDESPENKDILLHKHNTNMRIQYYYLIFTPLSNSPNYPNKTFMIFVIQDLIEDHTLNLAA